MGVLVREGSPCPLCRQPLLNSQGLLNFTFLDLPEPFAALDDRAVHERCLWSWDQRDAFIAHWNAKVRSGGLHRIWELRIKDGRLHFTPPGIAERTLPFLLLPVFLPVQALIRGARRLLGLGR